jgi:hypothetical protein
MRELLSLGTVQPSPVMSTLRGRARMANVTDAALTEITKLIHAERKA